MNRVVSIRIALFCITCCRMCRVALRPAVYVAVCCTAHWSKELKTRYKIQHNYLNNKKNNSTNSINKSNEKKDNIKDKEAHWPSGRGIGLAMRGSGVQISLKPTNLA